MIALLFLVVASFLLYRLLGGAPQLRMHRRRPAQPAASAKIDELTEYATKLRAGNNYTGAEKTYLQILKIDHRHTATYTRLGTLYLAMKNLSDAIECFEIASQLSPDGTTFYHLGSALYENRNPMKAIAAYEKAIMFEPSAKAYVGLAKSFNRVGNGEQLVVALERAAELEPNSRILWLLHDAYEATGRPEELHEVRERIRAIDPKDPRLRATPRRARVPGLTTAELEKTKS